MSPAGDSRRRRRRRIIGASGAAAVLATAVIGTAINYWPAGGTITLFGTAKYLRVGLLATRDLDTSTPCDLPAGGVSGNKPLVTDQTWTRTGGTSCYPIFATAAQCFDATEIPYTVDATGLGWVVEPDATNRITYSTAIDCTNWTCAGTASATPLQTAPDGSATATLATVGTWAVNILGRAATGYANNASLSLRVWAKCSSGTVHLININTSANGLWVVNCTTVGGVWSLITSTHAAVTVYNPFKASATGGSGLAVAAPSGTVSATIWAPTLTEESGADLSVIPTAAAAVSTGTPSWFIDNSTGKYYKSGDTVTQSITEIGGVPCWVVDGTVLRLSGATGTPCTGILYSLQVTR